MQPAIQPDHSASAKTLALLAIGLSAVTAVVVLVFGPPEAAVATDPRFIAQCTLLSFAGFAGQATALTGFLAYRQHKRGSDLALAAFGFAIGALGILLIVGFAMWSAYQQAAAGVYYQQPY